MTGSEKLSLVFRPSASGLEKFWGELEAELLEIIWTNGPMTVKRALYFINQRKKHAYTTIMTVMNNLARKGILIREKKRHSFVYTPAMEKEEFLKFAAEKIIGGLIEDYKTIAIPIMAQQANIKRKKSS